MGREKFPSLTNTNRHLLTGTYHKYGRKNPIQTSLGYKRIKNLTCHMLWNGMGLEVPNSITHLPV